MNLNKLSFDQWVEFVFDHPVSEPEWYHSDNWTWECDPEVMLKNATALFSKPAILLKRYTHAQIEQGFWFLLGPEGELCEWLWNEKISWNRRKTCVQSMVNVFKQLFTKTPLHHTCYMWWDLLRSFHDNPDRKMQNAMFETLCKILKIKSRECQMSALHGLGHLPLVENKERVIKDFLKRHPRIDPKIKSHALAAIQGRIL